MQPFFWPILLLSIPLNLISVELDVLIISFFDVVIHPQIIKEKFQNVLMFLAHNSRANFIIRLNDEIYFRSRLSEKIIQDVFIIVSGTRRRRNIKNTVVSVGLCMEKFNIVSNNHERTHESHFPVFDRKFPLWANLVKKKSNLSTGNWKHPL